MTSDAAAPPAIAEPKVPVLMGHRGLDLSSLDAAWRFAQGIVQGGMAPKGIREPGAVVAIIEAGMELGLPAMFALSHLTFINGKLGIMGDAAKALVLNSGKLDKRTGIRVRYEGQGDELRAIVTSHRLGEVEPVSHEFSVADAKKAKLWGKSGPWTEYPGRMLMYRALGFHVRDQYPDVMMGVGLREELEDYPEAGPKGRPERDVTPPKGADPLLALAATQSAVDTSESGGAQEVPGPGATDESQESEERVSGEPEDAVIVDPEPSQEGAEPPPPGDADAPAEPIQAPEGELPLGEEACPHLTTDGASSWIPLGDFETCPQCGAMRNPAEETVRDAKGRV